jgi:oxygen-dependent protoporphyrinogen oxidase
VGGLAAAEALRSGAVARGLDLDLLVLEASDRAGGCAGSEEVDGVLLERGPDTFVTHKPAGLALCGRLGLGARLEHPPAGGIDVWHRGRLLPVPEGFALVAPLRRRPLLSAAVLSWPGRLRAWCEPLLPPRRIAAQDESVAAFVRRRFGNELQRRLTEPLVGGISMSDTETLSLAATFPRFAALEAEPGRVSGERAQAAQRPAGPPVAALAGGMRELVDALVARLPARTLRLGSSVASLQRVADGFALSLADGTTLAADAVVVATPAPVAATLLAGLAPALAGELRGIDYASCATVTLVWPLASLRQPPRRQGFFVPRGAELPFVAAGFLHLKFPARVPAGLCAVRVFCGGGLHPEVAARRDDELAVAAAAALGPLLGATAPPTWSRVHRHPQSIPQKHVGHLAQVERIRQAARVHPRLVLAGGPLGAYGLPDAIAAGEAAAGEALTALGGDLR